MHIKIINPKNKLPLHFVDGNLVDFSGGVYPIVRGAVRIAESDNYTQNFGLQWNKFDKTQLDNETLGISLTRTRFFAQTQWEVEDLSGNNILEVGSGAGRFSKVVLEHTKGTLYSVDYSDAVTANYKNNGHIAPERFHLYQASIYELPFEDNSFDKVFCFGVLQHTPNFDESIKSLINKAKVGGEIVVDFYPIKGWWTKIHAKYLLRPITKRMHQDTLFRLIEKNVDWLIKAHLFLQKIGMSFITRFLPVVDIRALRYLSLNEAQFREWVILDTFDMYSPMYDNPQRIAKVVQMFQRHGAVVTFANYVANGTGSAAVVRGVKSNPLQ